VFAISGIFRADAMVYVEGRNLFRTTDNHTDKSSQETIFSESIVPIRYALEEKMNAYRILVGKPEGNKLLERPSGRWEDNIKWILEK
jgi:hypothetical protein